MNRKNFTWIEDEIKGTVKETIDSVLLKMHIKKPQKEEEPIFVVKPKGKILGMFLWILGIVISAFMGFCLLVNCLLAFFSDGNGTMPWYSWLIIGFFLGIGFFILGKGGSIRGRLRRFEMYKRRLAGKEYCQLKVLAKTTGKSVRYLKKDLSKMLELGMFPQGHMDEQETCLILTKKAYDQYQMMMEAKIRQEEENATQQMRMEQEERRRQEEEEERYGDMDETLRTEIRKIIKEGGVYLEQFDAICERLTGEIVHKKLSRLCLVTRRIFDYITDHPNQVGDIQRFMSYYLPTTKKLLDTYEELDKEPVQGENIVKAKKEILDTMDTINYAFENLLDSLYENTRMDISTDIAVLETMLCQEGLTGGDF